MRACLVLLVTLTSLSTLAQNMALRPFEAEGFAALNRGDYATCATIFATAAATYGSEPSPPFVAARCYAKLGDTGMARRFLSTAVDRGYRNCGGIEEALASFEDLRARCEANAEELVRTSNLELLAAYHGDRDDHTGAIADEAAVLARDAVRRDVVRLSLARGMIRTAADHVHAALVMQHGTTPEDFALARDLAKKAAELQPWLAEARWLFAAATDRHLHSIGKPQIFGTQLRQVDGRWTLEPFDPGAITDEERARWRAHSVAERQRFIAKLNGAE